MPLLRRADFDDLYARLSPIEARQFVADLYAARGWETSVQDGVVFARRDGVEKRLRPPAPASTQRDTVAATGVVVLDTEALVEMLRYAVGDETREALLQEYFGRDSLPTAETESPSPRASPSRVSWRSSVGFVALVLLFTAAFGLVGSGLMSSPSGPTGATGSSVAGVTDTRTAQAEPGDAAFPPGLSSAGVTDPERLVTAHRELLDNASYTWTLVYQVLDEGRVRGSYRGTVWVASERVYAVAVDQRGDVSGVGPGVGKEEYADGVTEWYSKNGTRCTRPIQGAQQYTDRATRYVEWLLQANETVLTDRTLQHGTAHYTVELRGDPWPALRETTGYVRVDERGRIHSLSRMAERPSDGATVRMTLKFSALGETTVSPPDWVEATNSVPGGCYPTY